MNKYLHPENIQKHQDHFDQDAEVPRLFRKFSSDNRPTTITQTEYLKMRNHFLNLLEARTGQRSGVPENFLYRELNAGYIVPQDGEDFCYYEVEKHKTAAQYGPAGVCLTILMNERLKIYAWNVRPLMSGLESVPESVKAKQIWDAELAKTEEKREEGYKSGESDIYKHDFAVGPGRWREFPIIVLPT